MSEIRQGEVWLARLGAAKAGELGKNRRCVVLTNSALITGAKWNPVTVVPLSATAVPSPLRPKVVEAGGRESFAMCDFVQSVTPTRLLERLGALTPEQMRRVATAVANVIASD
ncbi:MAG: type II toxin-antitoxin system PemK/MazF family toxin [Bifidobacteriaceae bacterium]|nr:type II toxin-antitoxin system PemK/MazF family toxin [Bifidobacteriaceae bacterium]